MTSAAFEATSPFATALREARSARSLSVADVARALLLSENQVAGLETDDFGSFYGASYAERAARRYAEFLRVDAELAGAPRGAVDSTGPVETVPAATPLGAPIKVDGTGVFTSPVVRWALAAGLAVVAVIVGAKFIGSHTTPTPVAQVQSSAPVAETPPADTLPVATTTEPPVALEAPAVPAPVVPVTTPAAATPTVVATAEPPKPAAAAMTPVPDDRDHRFFLVVTRDVTIRAKDVYGTVLLNGLQRPDVGRRVVGEPPFEVEVSNEDAVEIYYRGQRIRPGANTYDGIVASVVR